MNDKKREDHKDRPKEMQYETEHPGHEEVKMNDQAHRTQENSRLNEYMSAEDIEE
ncbi:hypothetical protein JCM19037_2618 [Geomicrobium sp. JCM 19037]|uniref:hypothetical protein n=1 Tax=unclassified Geomicrobium TaxID=2628951 RepID=UPI00045F3FA8|nr:hypothetical protein [Geomicrobium sp. JCM 19037]GAK04230.1 hypothetical protein JCM19037_2618 [Geomicrobium sp. JCM 19037]